uniref:Probable ATP-dependent Clp protease proteolytic subunit (Fragments) n=1 Tax=Populus euphratica TaxID=75702 RepID=CLPPH_POPEU|nr:RecName: Full=Probable ATP-dependent Clp protease proteolytic subunit; AltName: Full=Endopeptidase Clp [Populus euphratica]
IALQSPAGAARIRDYLYNELSK